MKIALIIVSVMLAIFVGLFIWKMYEAKKAKEKNAILDPTNVVSPATVSALTANATNPSIDTATAPVTPEASVQVATARMASQMTYGV